MQAASNVGIAFDIDTITRLWRLLHTAAINWQVIRKLLNCTSILGI